MFNVCCLDTVSCRHLARLGPTGWFGSLPHWCLSNFQKFFDWMAPSALNFWVRPTVAPSHLHLTAQMSTHSRTPSAVFGYESRFLLFLYSTSSVVMFQIFPVSFPNNFDLWVSHRPMHPSTSQRLLSSLLKKFLSTSKNHISTVYSALMVSYKQCRIKTH